jgi:hypothetical protein
MFDAQAWWVRDAIMGKIALPLDKATMLADVAEVGVMGNLEKVYETNAFSLMMWVLQKQKKVERLEEIRAAQENS